MGKYFPLENLVYKTKLTKEQAIQKLAENIEVEQQFILDVDNHVYTKPYLGKIHGYTFQIKRAIPHLNSFLPRIQGEVYSDVDGTKIKVKMRLSTFVLVFMTIWFCGIIAVFAASIFEMFTQGFSLFFLLPIVMFSLGYGLMHSAFNPESALSKADLMHIFKAEIQH